jgi:hypothetical protein
VKRGAGTTSFRRHVHILCMFDVVLVVVRGSGLSEPGTANRNQLSTASAQAWCMHQGIWQTRGWVSLWVFLGGGHDCRVHILCIFALVWGSCYCQTLGAAVIRVLAGG